MVGIRLLGANRFTPVSVSGTASRFRKFDAAAGKGVVQQAAVGQRGIAQESAARELLVRHDAVEAVGLAVVQIVVTRGVEAEIL